VKRVKLEQHLRAEGCHFSHHGGKHDIWINPANGKDAPIPRHAEIKKWTARGICKALDVRVPAGE
jgi:mRNA interferase HicA